MAWPAPTGRERAIEALIDREPHGDFYRAARVVEEALPAAQTSRPNLVTKAALVEQAFGLQHAVLDTVQKYNFYHDERDSEADVQHRTELQHQQQQQQAAAASTSSTTTSTTPAAATSMSTSTRSFLRRAAAAAQEAASSSTSSLQNKRQGIWKHQAKIVAAKKQQQQRGTVGRSNSNSALVATLRNVFESTGGGAVASAATTTLEIPGGRSLTITTTHPESSTSSSSKAAMEFRQLLQAVQKHTILSLAPPLPPPSTVKEEEEAASTDPYSTSFCATEQEATTAKRVALQANLEDLMTKLSKMDYHGAAAASDTSGVKKDDEDNDGGDATPTTASVDSANAAAAATSSLNDSNHNTQVLTGLLVTLLSLLSPPTPEDHHHVSAVAASAAARDDPKVAARNERVATDTTDDSDNDAMDTHPEAFLQVGSIMALLSLDGNPNMPTRRRRTNNNNKKSSNKKKNASTSKGGGTDDTDAVVDDDEEDENSLFSLDSSLLEYFAQAAAVQEERWELIRLRAMAATTPPCNKNNREQEQDDDAGDDDDDDDDKEITMPTLLSSSTTGSTDPVVVVEPEEEGQDGMTTPRNTTASSAATTTSTEDNVVATAATTAVHPEAVSGGDDDDDVQIASAATDSTDPQASLPHAAVVQQDGDDDIEENLQLEDHEVDVDEDGSESDSDEDDDDDDDDEGDDDDEDDEDHGHAYQAHDEEDGGGPEGAPEEEAPDLLHPDADPSSESSSSSDDDDEEEDDDDDHEAAFVESERDMDSTDDDDDAVLRQALAISLGETTETQDTETDGIGDAGGGSTSHSNTDTLRVVLTDANHGQGAQEQVDGPGGFLHSHHSEGDEEDANNPTSETPVSENNSRGDLQSADSLDQGGGPNDDDDDDDDQDALPHLPAPPTIYPFFSSLTQSGDPDVLEHEKPLAVFDPANLTRFGALPSSLVLVHLLRHMQARIQQQRDAAAAKDDSEIDAETRLEDRVPITTVPGGMGSTLFARPGASGSSSGSNSKRDGGDKKGCTTASAMMTSDEAAHEHVVLQLLVACFLRLLGKRQEAIDDLRKTIAREHKAAQGGGGGTVSLDHDEQPRDDDDDRARVASSPVVGDEQDDPALTLALNYVEDDAPLSFESLENKGMRRKAAAAAHDAAAHLKSLRKMTEDAKEKVKLYSHCTMLALRSLQNFMQTIVLTWLYDDQNLSPKELGLCPLVRSKLAMAFEALTSAHAQSSFLAMVGGEESDLQRVFYSVPLYKASIFTWAECVPLLYPTTRDQVRVLRSLVEKLAVKDAPDLLSQSSLESVSAFPSMEHVHQAHKLQVLCQRLRVCDLLDDMVSGPIPYLPSDDDDGDDESSRNIIQSKLLDGPHLAGSLAVMLGRSLENLVGAAQAEVQGFYLALCHRIHTRVILMDGLYAITETNPDKGSPPVAAVSKKTGTTDLISVSANPSSDLQFDATKCSDSIALLSGMNESASGGNGSSVHQRASKVWGTVLSTQHFSPKTGVHRWAVRLDKCERGHVFVGVATAQASMRTYVGGDKYGWGMIGTQALWHDRRKIRGDYGATFRTGSIIIVTLDTDAGTLSLGSWKDNQSTSAMSADPLVHNLLSPRRQGQIGGTIEDWGVAFEGLPLDSRLFPAVGLYQRDDRVTLLPVESDAVGLGGSIETLGGECFFPRVSAQESEASEISQIRKYNELLAWDGVEYAADTLQLIGDCLQREEKEVLSSLLPCLSSAISLLPPSVPILSVRGALTLMPHTTRCLSELRKFRSKQKEEHHMFENGLKDGEWVIRASSGQGDLEEYIVGFESVRDDSTTSVGFEGSGVGTTGKSKNGLVAIYGTMKGSLLSFIEEWSDERTDSFSSSSNTRDDSSACVVSARTSLDGSRFEGTYRNVEFGTSGKIVGIRQEKPIKLGRLRLKHAPHSSLETTTSMSSVAFIGEATLCLAHTHLSTIVANNVAKDIAGSAGRHDDALGMDRIGHLQGELGRPLLSCASLCLDEKSITQHLDELKKTYAPPVPQKEIAGLPFDFMLHGLSSDSFGELDEKLNETSLLRELAAKGDEILAPMSGGQGSLHAFSHAEYLSTRMSIAAAMVHHCCCVDKLSSLSNSLDKDDALVVVWRRALRLMEDGTRRAISGLVGSKKEQCVKLYRLYDAISSFLLELEIPPDRSMNDDLLEEVAQLYSSIQSESELGYMRAQIHGATVSSIVRTLVLKDIVSLLSEDTTDNSAATESIVAGLPKILGLVRVENVERVNATGSEPSKRPGTSSRIRETLEKSVSDVFHFLLKIWSTTLAARPSAKSKEALAMVDSLTLSMLTVFVGCFRGEDVAVAVEILANLKEVFAIHRPALLTVRPEGSRSAGVQTLAAIAKRDVSRAVLRFSIATVHVVLYQVVRREPRGDDECMNISDCLSWFCVELGVIFPYMERYFLREIHDSVKTTGDEEWDRWCSTRKVGSQSQKKAAPGRSGLESGTTYFWDYGTIPFMNASQANKQSLRQKTTGSRSSAESTGKLKAGFAHRHLSQWLHALCTVLRSSASSSLKILAKDQRWVTVLLRANGLLDERDDDGMIEKVKVRKRDSGVLPARHRARLVLFFYHLLIRLDPCAPLVEGLFCIAGAEIVAGTIDDEEHLVSREAVSLLRKLHNPSCPRWRQCINTIVPEIATGKSFTKRAGLRSFLNGGIATVRRLSHVLLKPAAAVPLSQENQSSPSIKGSTSASQAPAPVGTDAVVAGLMRFEADGGIVSSIDTKSGVCEVVLMIRDASRSRYSFIERTDHLPVTGRQTLTVRALRTPLSDVVNAQEVPLFIGGSLPATSFILPVLKASMESLISATSPAAANKEAAEKRVLDEEVKEAPEEKSMSIQEDTTQLGDDNETCVASSVVERRATTADASGEIKSDEVATKDEEEPEPEMSDAQNVSSGILGLALDLMTIRSCIVLLSDPQVLSEFLKDDASREMIPRLLQLAWPERNGSADGSSDVVRAARSMAISSLSIHEANFGHLMTLLREVGFRANAMKQAPEETWRTRLEGYKSNRQQAEQSPPSTSPQAPPPPTTATSRVTSRSLTAASNEGNNESQSHQSISQSTGGSNSEDEEEQGEAAATVAAQHLREAAIAQMAELGIPRSYSELALRRIGGTNIEAAVHFCLENGTDIERLLAEEMGRQAAGRGSSQNRDGRDDGHLLRQLLEMGFPRRWCTEALAATGNNVDEALTWILNNNETLESMDTSEDDEEDGNGEMDEEEEDESEEDESEEGEVSPGADAPQESQGNDSKPDAPEPKPDKGQELGWTASVTPLRVISGRATIDSKTLEVSGQPNGGFASVGVKGVLLKNGKWYYEVILGTAGCIQLGFGDASFAGHCNADRGDGCGDSSSSFSFDGWRRLRWHATATEWGCRWKEGDVIGCFVDLNSRVMAFTLNGQAEDIGMGVAFTGFNYCGGLYPVVSFNRRERLRIILGGSGDAFKYPPPSDYRGVGEALIESVKEWAKLLQKESVLGSAEGTEEPKKFLCDFSDEEHGHELFSWSHRYYGSDASVHLGSGRSKHSSSKSSQSGSLDSTPASQLSRRLDKAWSSEQKSASPSDESSPEDCMKEGYDAVHKEIAYELFNESIVLGVILARKLMLHIIVTCKEFDPSIFVRGKDSEFEDMQRLWGVIEACANLRSWSGEAGAMAIAAEALGLGIQIQSRSSLEGSGLASDEGASHPRTGYSQLLSTVVQQAPIDGSRDTSRFMAAAAEAAFAGEGGGAALIFLQESLQQAVVKSPAFRQVLVVAIRRYVRLLAVVEDSDPRAFAEDEGDGERTTSDGPKGEEKHHYAFFSQPDARLAAYFTGILLSTPVQQAVENAVEIRAELFQAWSLGLLSASLPWRMVCAFTASAILSQSPGVLSSTLNESPTLARYYGRLPSTVARRAWAERAAFPVCSRYIQAMLELLSVVKRCSTQETDMPFEFTRYWRDFEVEASSPRPLLHMDTDSVHDWESHGGWVSCEEIWSGVMLYEELDWKKPPRSAVRTLMDGGEGPPMLRAGCTVMRGPDWDSSNNEDGFDIYESAKEKREKETKEKTDELPTTEEDANAEPSEPDPADIKDEKEDTSGSSKRRKKKKVPHPKLPVGTVLSVEPWKGLPALGRKVHWTLTGEEGIYRYGGDGGRHDISHVETNEKCSRVVKKFPFPETAEQCAARRGFGSKKSYSILLRLRRNPDRKVGDAVNGILEMPDFGSAIKVRCTFEEDGSIILEEHDLLFGSKDSGWEARFGQPTYVPGSRYVLKPGKPKQDRSFNSFYEELSGTNTFDVKNVRNPADGGELMVTNEMRLLRGQRLGDGSFPSIPPPPPPLSFDHTFHAPSLAISRDGRTVTCVASDGRGTAFATTGFSKGSHYFEFKIEQGDSGSVFIGVAEKPPPDTPRLNRWHGWGFVNFRATYSAGSERVYGVHAHAGDTIGMLLDCDAGRLSFFYDGLKYGEHILNDLGCAYENLSPFGFSVEGCGTGGPGQASPSGFPRSPTQGFVRPRTLFPVIGLRNHGDRVSFLPSWTTTYGVDGVTIVKNVLSVDELLQKFASDEALPGWFLNEAFFEYQRWSKGTWAQTATRGSRPYRVDLDTSEIGCAAASSALGMKYALLPGDRIRLKRSAGRVLELAEEAVILGQHQQRIIYKIVAQKNEGQSLSEGADLPHCFVECDVVDDIEFLSEPKGQGILLPTLDRFRCMSSCGLKIVYSGGAVIRSDLEINDMSNTLGTIPSGTVIPQLDVLERRVNSCGVVRYRVKFKDLEGYISANIRGGSEEAIVEQIPSESAEDDEQGTSFPTPLDCARKWIEDWRTAGNSEIHDETFVIDNSEEFEKLLGEASVPGLSAVEFNNLLSNAVSGISNFSKSGDALGCNFQDIASALSFALGQKDTALHLKNDEHSNAATNQAAAAVFAKLPSNASLPSLTSVLVRVAVIRTLNRRARYALPWLPVRPYQEGSAILGGLCGHGTSIDKAGRSRILCRGEGKWTHPPSIAERVRSSRGLFFSSVKREFLEGITQATTTPTPLSHDDYELPREIRTVRINRMRAARAMVSDDASAKRKYSVFSQLQNETKNWGGAALRRAYVAKGHGGQRRAFRVKFVGEGVNDYSGPYREVFTDAVIEILTTDVNGNGVLGVLDATPNKAAEIGENRDLHMFSLNGQDLTKLDMTRTIDDIDERELWIRESFSSLLAPRDEASREVEEALVFLGRITGTAYRHGIPVDLPLPIGAVWRAIVENLDSNPLDSLREVDLLAAKSNPSSPILWWQQRMLNSFVEGLSNVMPVEILPLLSADELRDTICGNPEIDVDLLKSVVEYEGYSEDDDVIGYFWDTLREVPSEDRRAFLRFVWARCRLPLRASDFDAAFKIQKDVINIGERADQALPSASTCFFSLTLPEYSSVEILKAKLMFAIHNVTTMETDFQTNSAEIAEGYRAL